MSPLPLPLPTNNTGLFSASVGLFLFCMCFICIVFFDSTYKWYHTVFAYLCLTFLLNIILPRSIYVAENGKISFFLWMSNIPLCVQILYIHTLYIHIYVYIWNIFFIHSSANRYLGSFKSSYCKECCCEHWDKPLTVWITTNCGKFLKRWEYQTTLPASWETCMQVKKQQSEPDTEQQTGSKLGKEYVKAVYCHPAYLTSMRSIPCNNATLDESQAEIKIDRRNINNLRCADDTTLMADSEEELKSLLMKVKGENEKGGLKLSIQKTKITASSPITSWQIDGEKVEIVTDFIFLDSKITVDSDCSHEIKRHFLLGRKAMPDLPLLLSRFSRVRLCATP